MATKKLDLQQVKRAIFLDYEGNKDKPPTLLGWRVDGQSFAAIVEPAFHACQKGYRAKHVCAQNHKKLVSDLINQAIREDRCIVSWSQHDLREMNKVISPAGSMMLDQTYRNALTTARPWHWHKFQASANGATLSYFCELFRLKVPQKFGTGKVGSALRALRKQLAEGRSYGDLTHKAKEGWIAVVRHNAFDLLYMEKILTKIAISQID